MDTDFRVYLSLRQAARAVGLGVHTLREARDRGELRVAVLSPRTHRIAVEDLRRWLEQHHEAGSEPSAARGAR